ncbi:MAG: hypothetical protein EXS38_01635 [Opitutus sp.]|nr:hypothetical protein [Opitutus sp.]
MKRSLALFFFVLASGLRAEIEFSGFFLTARESLFSLTETEGNRSSGWLKIGQSFGEHSLVSFDAAREVITLRQDGRLREVPLRASKVKDGRVILTGTITLLQEQVEGVRASLFLGEEGVYPLKEGVTLRIRSEQRPDGNIVYHSRFDMNNADGKEDSMDCPSIVARPGSSFSMRMGDLGFTFKP